eukprot:55684_1
MLWLQLMLICRWYMAFGQSNDLVVGIATEYLDGANDFYSGRDKHNFFQHLSDEFEWFVGSDSFSGKQTFIDANDPAFGAVDNVFGHHEVISYRNTDNDEQNAFVLTRLSTFVQQKKCSEWFENMEVFIFNEQKQIKSAFAVFMDQTEYTAKQAKVNHPDCTMVTDETASDTDDTPMQIESVFERFVKDIIEANDGTFEDATDDCEYIGYPLSQRFGVHDIKHIHFTQYGIGPS